MPLTNKIVLITGGGSGIGRATAHAFAAEGATVVICGRNQYLLEETKEEAPKFSGQIKVFLADITDPLEIEGVITNIFELYGKIDILVNNAGIMLVRSVLETTPMEWASVIETNLNGTFLCSKMVLPYMISSNGGVIINVSSVLGKKGIGKMSAYCASKFATIGFTQSLAEETKADGVKVYAVCPGATDTALHRSVVGKEVAKIAMQPGKVASLIVDLATGRIHIPSGGDIVIDEHAVTEDPGLLGKLMRLRRILRSGRSVS